MPTDVEKSAVEELVDRQLRAYNMGDYETFALCYDSNIISYDLTTAEPIFELSGIHFFQHYSKKFSANPQLHCQVTQRIVHNNLVIDKELICNCNHSSFTELVIYQIDRNQITKMWFKKEPT